MIILIVQQNVIRNVSTWLSWEVSHVKRHTTIHSITYNHERQQNRIGSTNQCNPRRDQKVYILKLLYRNLRSTNGDGDKTLSRIQSFSPTQGNTLPTIQKQ